MTGGRRALALALARSSLKIRPAAPRDCLLLGATRAGSAGLLRRASPGAAAGGFGFPAAGDAGVDHVGIRRRRMTAVDAPDPFGLADGGCALLSFFAAALRTGRGRPLLLARGPARSERGHTLRRIARRSSRQTHRYGPRRRISARVVVDARAGRCARVRAVVVRPAEPVAETIPRRTTRGAERPAGDPTVQPVAGRTGRRQAAEVFGRRVCGTHQCLASVARRGSTRAGLGAARRQHERDHPPPEPSQRAFLPGPSCHGRLHSNTRARGIAARVSRIGVPRGSDVDRARSDRDRSITQCRSSLRHGFHGLT